MNESDVFKVFGNKNRVLILQKLLDKNGSASHSDLSYKLKLNPKSTKDHLDVLMKHNIIERASLGYVFTDLGWEIAGLLEAFIILIRESKEVD